MGGQSGRAARERRDAHAQLQVRHAARAAGCQTKTCHRQTSIVPSQWCVSVSCVLSRVSWPTAEQRETPIRGQETVSRSVCLSVCLSRVASCDSVLVALAQFAHQWARGFCICSIARTGDVCPGNCPLRAAENASSGVRKRRNVRVVLFGST